MDFSSMTQYLPLYYRSIGVTLLATLLSLLLGFIIAIPLTLCKISNNKFFNGFAKVYTSIFRGVPLLVQIMIAYFGIPQLFNYKITSMQAGVLTFALNSAAFLSENLRGGIMAVDEGQWEAAESLAIPYYKMMKDIIFPQAMKSILPSLVNESINLLKNTSLVSTIGLVDILRTGQMVMNATYKAFEPLLISAVFYYILVTGISLLAGQLERMVNKSDRNKQTV
ncbi:amino acid ABC transporter permease [Peptoniphilus catoniae]|uniref:amino acid ABC transporter permease n=1 Tax=Peptoniphilus catoniae TaxID=1660341 RepID=UPI0010FE8D95|nr:amino acid ABC transporter permease [Peptoniphilus catoniae]